MDRKCTYLSPLGEMILAAEGGKLCGAWFAGQKYFPAALETCPVAKAPVLNETKRWLDTYFAGANPGRLPELCLHGTTFQIDVWNLLREIPYGCVTTYGVLAAELAKRRGLARMSAQAVGGAIGKNPISVLIPCHRVLGADGSLTGYAGGTDKKEALLRLEAEGNEEKRTWFGL